MQKPICTVWRMVCSKAALIHVIPALKQNFLWFSQRPYSRIAFVHREGMQNVGAWAETTHEPVTRGA